MHKWMLVVVLVFFLVSGCSRDEEGDYVAGDICGVINISYDFNFNSFWIHKL